MKKRQKQDILEMINTLHQAQDEIKKYTESKQYIYAQDMLIQCQECAISIGTAIEKSEGNDCMTIPYIEEYCDFLYHVHEKLTINSDTNANKIYKALRKHLLKIENSVRSDIPVKKEIAFFPYKASMWDSLESVYIAAKKQPNCEVYCVPIPYYDKNKDGSFGQMHYEGGEYPKNIEVIDWQTYNFEERNPDIIYIHNAYDDWNLVTCVHPRFFSKRLKEHTNELIYIPYFVLGEIEPGNQSVIDRMKHFCFLPGIINADKVIVQSEKMKQIYVNEYIKAAQKYGLSGNHLNKKKMEEKFLGLGSPKIDRVLNIIKDDLVIPDEWMKIIQKSDGNWKKIIFYNTSIAALLQHNEKMIEKMEYVFDIFKQNQNEVALLWRPHPLIKATISSMRPHLWQEYSKLVKKYNEEGWGIYDDTSDIDRAVVLADAYYGDESSVIQLCQAARKLVMVQCVNFAVSSKPVISADCIITNKKICWYGFNFIMLQDIECKMRNAYAWLYTGEYTAAYEIEGKIYFAPMAGNKIIILDLHLQQMDSIELFQDEYINIANKFYHIRKCNNSIFFLPGKYPYILEYILDKDQIKKYPLDLGNVGARLNKTLIFYESSHIYNDKIFLASSNNGTIYSFDIKSKAGNYYHITDNTGFTTICGFENKLYLADKEGNIFRTIIDDSRMSYTKICKNESAQIRKSICWNDKIIMFLEEVEGFILINPYNDTCENIILSESDIQQYNGNKYGEPKVLDDKLYIFNKIRRTITVFDKNMTFEEYKVTDIKKESIINYYNETKIFENNATEVNTLAFFLSKIKDSTEHEIISNRNNKG